MKKLNQRFYLLLLKYKTKLTNLKGGGIGLSVCNQLAKLMSGKLWVESQMNAGSIFYFNILAKAVPVVSHALMYYYLQSINRTENANLRKLP